MHLSPSQCKRFYKLFYSLLDYANVTFDILGESFAPYAGDLGTQQVTALSRYVFEENPDVIDRYIADNPDHLSARELRQVDDWHAAFPSRFILIEHKAAHAAFLAEDYVFNVTGLTMNLHKVLPNAPTVAETVLLPFDCYIVYGVNMTEYNLDLAPELIDVLYDEYHRLLDEQRVATSAQEFLVEAPLCRQRRAENVKLLHELRGGLEDEDLGFHDDFGFGDDDLDFWDDDFGFGDDLDLDPGEFSVSPLAGLNPEQRRTAIDEYLTNTDDDGIFASDFSDFVIPSAPVRTIAESLESATKEELAELCRTFRIKAFSKLNKHALLELLGTRFASPSAQDIIDLFARSFYTSALELAKSIYDAGGLIEMPRDEYDALPYAEQCRTIRPFLNVFAFGGTVSYVIPDEVMAALAPADWERAIAEHKRHARLRHIADTYLLRCGIVAVEELADLCLRYYPHDYTRQELIGFFISDGPDELMPYNRWIFDGHVHLMGIDLLADSELASSMLDAVEVNGDMIAKPSGAGAFRRYLYECHSKHEMWEVPSKSAAELEAYNYNKRIESLPSYLALQDFLDRHIPFDQDEYLFTDFVLDELVTMVRLEYDPADISDCLMDWGLDFSEKSDAEAMSKLLTDFFIDIPLWSGNGWSATELTQRGSEH